MKIALRTPLQHAVHVRKKNTLLTYLSGIPNAFNAFIIFWVLLIDILINFSGVYACSCNLLIAFELLHLQGWLGPLLSLLKQLGADFLGLFFLKFTLHYLNKIFFSYHDFIYDIFDQTFTTQTKCFEPFIVA